MAYQFDNMMNFIDTQMAHDAVSDFMRAPLTGDIMEVPGINSSEKQKLALTPEPIHTTFQLIGKVLMLKTFDPRTMQLINCEQHCALVAHWLYHKGIANGHSIALILIEKLGTMMPGLYDIDQFN